MSVCVCLRARIGQSYYVNISDLHRQYVEIEHTKEDELEEIKVALSEFRPVTRLNKCGFEVNLERGERFSREFQRVLRYTQTRKHAQHMHSTPF